MALQPEVRIGHVLVETPEFFDEFVREHKEKEIQDLEVVVRAPQLWDSQVLTSLPDSIGDLPSLRRLKITSGFREWVYSGPEFMSYIQQDQRRLRELPSSIANLVHLTSLKLIDCEFRRFPEAIGRLTALSSLKIEGCNWLQALPESFGELQGLVSLKLRNTVFEKVPEQIRRLRKLEKLDLTYAYIERLPEWLLELPLKRLNVHCNRLAVDTPWNKGIITALLERGCEVDSRYQGGAPADAEVMITPDQAPCARVSL